MHSPLLEWKAVSALEVTVNKSATSFCNSWGVFVLQILTKMRSAYLILYLSQLYIWNGISNAFQEPVVVREKFVARTLIF